MDLTSEDIEQEHREQRANRNMFNDEREEHWQGRRMRYEGDSRNKRKYENRDYFTGQHDNRSRNKNKRGGPPGGNGPRRSGTNLQKKMEETEVSVLEKLMVFGNVCRFASKNRIDDSWLEALEIGEAERQNQVYDLWFFKGHMNGSKQESSEILQGSWVFKILPREIQRQIKKAEPEKGEEII